MKELKFFRCKHCGNIVVMLHDSGAPIVCCGEAMELLIPDSTEASTEKHIPAVTITGDTVAVQVGSVPHPMLPEHHIEFICMQTQTGIQVCDLAVGGPPTASFRLADGDRAVTVYEYCNIHGLWKADV